MKLGRLSLVLATLAAMPPAALSAQTCGGSTFSTCASVSINKNDLGLHSGLQWTQIVMTVTNLSGTNGTYSGTIFTAMGLYNLTPFSYVNFSWSSVNSGPWVQGSGGLTGAGITGQVAGGHPQPPPISNGLSAGESVILTFTISGPSYASVDVNNWAIHGQNGPLDQSFTDGTRCSTKLISTGGTVNSGPYDPNCAEPGGGGGASVAPEPASLMLVGSGLFGMVGGVVRRRRSKLG